MDRYNSYYNMGQPNGLQDSQDSQYPQQPQQQYPQQPQQQYPQQPQQQYPQQYPQHQGAPVYGQEQNSVDPLQSSFYENVLSSQLGNTPDFYSIATPESSETMTHTNADAPYKANPGLVTGQDVSSHLNNYMDYKNASISSSDDASAVSFKKEDCKNFEQQLGNLGDLSSNNGLSREDEQNEDSEGKKKEQNRAAQRAFRQRKEAKLKELQIKLSQSEIDKQEMENELKQLRKQTLEMSMENKVLLNTQQINGSSALNGNQKVFAEASSYNFPTKGEFQDFILKGSRHPEGAPMSDKIYESPQGDVLLTIPATWDFLQNLLNEMESTQGKTFDTYTVMKNLKGNELCHGHGAAYLKTFIISVVHQFTEDY